MLKKLIEWSVANKLIVLVFTAFAVAAGVIAMRRTPLEALPDLSDVQVIVQTEYEGQNPLIIEDQVTYPIATEMLNGPGLLVLRSQLRLRHLRGRHRPLLGEEPGDGVPLGHPWEASRRGGGRARPGRLQSASRCGPCAPTLSPTE